MAVKKGTRAYDRKVEKAKLKRQKASKEKTLKKPFVRAFLKKGMAELSARNEALVRRSNQHMRCMSAWRSKAGKKDEEVKTLSRKLAKAKEEIKAMASENKDAKALKAKNAKLDDVNTELWWKAHIAEESARKWAWVLPKVDKKTRDWLVGLAQTPPKRGNERAGPWGEN